MKYSTQLITRNRTYRPLAPIGQVLHCTDDLGATAQDEHDNFNDNDTGGIAAHTFTDANEIINTVPFNEQAQHAGAYANTHFIGNELCMPKIHDPVMFKAIWDNGVQLFADISIEQIHTYVVTPDNLLSHAEVSVRWHQSTHQDPVVYFAEYGKTVDDFRTDVQNELCARLANALAAKGWSNSPTYWMAVFAGAKVFDLTNFTMLLRNITGCSVTSTIVAALLSHGWCSSPDYWTNVLQGKQTPNMAYVIKLLGNAVK